ncbi:MAG TPA: HAMP domain-containing sensor histidine kinase, partial [Stellaceae bacterium]|nr:HAMP domain-containing sensor histidine kinase [Stellaceae bacterium]
AQAAEIVRYLSIAADGALRLSLPPSLAEFYSQGYGRAAYAVLDADGRVLFSSLPYNRAITEVHPSSKGAEFFQQDSVGAIAPVRPVGRPVEFFRKNRNGLALYGATVPINLQGRQILVQVVEDVLHRDVLIDDILAQFLTHVGWITAPLLLVLLMIDVAIFRGAMQPIITASRRAEQISPNNIEPRLPERDMPREVLPLVRAVNQALDRLKEGYLAQREFTADAAHELRTPLAILRTQVDMIEDRELAEALRNDVESMSRLVNQLLEMAELEDFVIGDDEIADLGAVASEIAAYIAPLALARGKTVAVTGPRRPVRVRGNSDALGRAVRNLVENALTHTAPDTSVEIVVDPSGALQVMDHGPGVPVAARDHIFRRFWRGDRRRSGSSGLGLAIVARIVEMHGATVTIGDRPGGGAVFMIRFPAVLPAPAVIPAQLETAA